MPYIWRLYRHLMVGCVNFVRVLEGAVGGRQKTLWSKYFVLNFSQEKGVLANTHMWVQGRRRHIVLTTNLNCGMLSNAEHPTER